MLWEHLLWSACLQGTGRHLIHGSSGPPLVLAMDACVNLHKLPSHWLCPFHNVKGMTQVIPKASARLSCSQSCGKGRADDLIRIPYQKLSFLLGRWETLI